MNAAFLLIGVVIVICILLDRFLEKLPIPPYLTLTCDPRYGVHLYATQGFIGGIYACNLHIEESGIGQAFCDFIRTLPQSRYVWPPDRTLALLDELLQGLKA